MPLLAPTETLEKPVSKKSDLDDSDCEEGAEYITGECVALWLDLKAEPINLKQVCKKIHIQHANSKKLEQVEIDKERALSRYREEVKEARRETSSLSEELRKLKQAVQDSESRQKLTNHEMDVLRKTHETHVAKINVQIKEKDEQIRSLNRMEKDRRRLENELEALAASQQLRIELNESESCSADRSRIMQSVKAKLKASEDNLEAANTIITQLTNERAIESSATREKDERVIRQNAFLFRKLNRENRSNEKTKVLQAQSAAWRSEIESDNDNIRLRDHTITEKDASIRALHKQSKD